MEYQIKNFLVDVITDNLVNSIRNIFNF